MSGDPPAAPVVGDLSSQLRLDRLIETERLRPFLPLVYMAWSDGELAAEEIRGICTAVESHPGIDEDCRTALRRWLDPEHPPTPDELEHLRQRVAGWAARLKSPPGSVADLGIAVTEATRPGGQITNDERAAIADVEARIGPLGPVPPGLRHPIALRRLVEPAPSFEVNAMTAILDGNYAETRHRMFTVLARPEFAYPGGIETGDYRQLVLRWLGILADEGFGRLGYAPPYGPGESGAFVAAFATLAHHDLSLLTKFGVQFGLFGGAIARLGTATHHDQYLDDVGSLKLAGCFAMTETGHGSNVRDLETRAVYDPVGDELVITTPHDLARKDYIGNAALHGQLAVVFARLIVDGIDHGVHAVLVPIRTGDGTVLPGVRIEDSGNKGGLNGVDNGRIWFHDVRVPRTALLNRFASIDEAGTYTSDIPDPDRRFFTTIGTLVGGRVSVGSAAISTAKSALTIALRYAHRRRQFGPALESESLLIDYPLHQQRLIPRLATTYAYHFAFESLAGNFAGGEGDARHIEARAAGLKAFGSWHALDTIQAAREACGGQGFLAENRLATMRADADIFTTYEGDNTVLAQLLAKGLLSDFKHQFESMGTTGMVRHVLRRAVDAVTELSPVTRSATEAGELMEVAWQTEQLRWRQDHQVETLAKRIKKRLDNGVESFAAFTQVQSHAMAAAAGHIDLLVHEEFATAVARLNPGPERAVLDKLVALHGLARIKADLGYFQEHGRLSAASAKAVRKQHDRLVSELAIESLALVDAFGIPDLVLAAPIATRDSQ